MEIRTSMVTCPNGHHYDSSKYAVCPVCGAPAAGGADTGSFTPTEAPGMGAGAAGSFTPTEAPGSPAGYAGNAGYNAAFGETIAPEQARSNPDPFGVPTIGGFGADEGTVDPVVGWLVCISGPSRGTDYRIHAGYNYIGRETGDIRIGGDLQISRQKHAMIAYDSGEHLYFVGPSEGRNIIKVNGHAVLNAVEIQLYDVISIGTTKLMFVPLCSDRFSWEEQ